MAMPLALPPADDLYSLDRIDRAILEARIKAKIAQQRREAIHLAQGTPDICDWAESNFYNPQFCKPDQKDFSNVPKIKLTNTQKRIFRHCFTISAQTGRFPYRTYVISKPKKTGKTTEGAIIGSWFADNIEAPNSVKILANDREQSSSRVFGFMRPTLTSLGAKRFETPFKRLLPNGTVVSASTSDPGSEAGDTYGLTLWDELWAYTSERSRLLWSELPPILTRNNSIRVITTYAGFEDQSDLLLELYYSIFKNTRENDLNDGARPVAGLEDIRTTDADGNSIPACYENPSKQLFYYNDHEQRMTWYENSENEADALALGVQEADILRHKENRWQKTDSTFLSKEQLDNSFSGSASVRQAHKMTLALDASSKNDCTAAVGSYADDTRYKTNFVQVWYPKRQADGVMDLQVVIDCVVNLWKQGLIHRRPDVLIGVGEKKLIDKYGATAIDVHYDPMQMHQVAIMLLKNHKLLIVEFDQKRKRLLADTFLKQLYADGNIDNVNDPELRSHLESAKAESQTDANSSNLIRIVKGSGQHAQPIDIAVAQSMSIYSASKRPRSFSLASIPQGEANGWQA